MAEKHSGKLEASFCSDFRRHRQLPSAGNPHSEAAARPGWTVSAKVFHLKESFDYTEIFISGLYVPSQQ